MADTPDERTARIDAEAYTLNAELEHLLRKVFKVSKKGIYKSEFSFEDDNGDDVEGTVRVPFIPAPKTAADLSRSLDAVILSAQSAATTAEILSAGLVLEQHQQYLETFLITAALAAGDTDDLRLEHQFALTSMSQRDAITTTLEIIEADIRDLDPGDDEDDAYDPDEDDGTNDDYFDACDAFDYVEEKLARKSEEILDYGATVLRDVAARGW